MKKGLLLSVFSMLAVLGLVPMAGAGSVDWQYLTHPSAANKGPGTDGLMGTGDDAADPVNTSGALSTATTSWDPADPQCGPDGVSYMTGIEVDCLGTPVGQATATYLNVFQTESIPGSGSTTIKLTPGGGPNTADHCGLGEFHATKDTTIYSTLGGIPMTDTPADGILYDADVTITSNWTCPATSTVYAAAYLDSIRQLAPAGATGFMVVCGYIEFGPIPFVPCLNNATSGSLVFAWTDDELNCSSSCCDDDGDDYDGSQCTGTDCNDADPAVNPGATEICGNGKDDDCVGGDEACAGSCSAGPVP